MTLVLIIISSIAIGIVSWHYLLGWLSFVTLLPLFALASRVRGRKLLLYIWLVGLISSLLTWAWMLTTRPEVWAGIEGILATAILMAAWLLTAFIYSLGIVPIGLLLARYNINPGGRMAIMVLPAAWTIGEYVRGWLFSVYSLGPGGTIGPHWNFGSFGFAASASPLVSLSRYLGLFGLTFVVALINVLFWQLLAKRRLVPLMGLMTILLLSGLAWQQYRPDGAQQQIGLLNLAEEDKTYADLLSRHDSPSKLFVLPEYSFYFSDNADRTADLPKLITPDGLIINAGLEHRRLFTDRYSRVTYRNQAGDIISDQQKTFLIPTGEYLPYWIEWLLRRSGKVRAIDSFNQMNQVQAGQRSEQIVDSGPLRVGTLSCSGVITPTFYQRLAKEGANVLVNTAALNIFSGSPLYYQQNRQIARFQAVANAKPFIQAAKSGPSYVVDSDGRFIAESSGKQTSIITAKVRPGNRTTPYSQLGEWMVAASGLLMLALGIKWLGRRI